MKVANNTATGNGGGLQVTGNSCLVVGNSATTGPLGNIVVAPGNSPGPIGGTALLLDGNPYANVVH
jgi:predicted outer membrane repeat protein